MLMMQQKVYLKMTKDSIKEISDDDKKVDKDKK